MPFRSRSRHQCLRIISKPRITFGSRSALDPYLDRYPRSRYGYRIYNETIIQTVQTLYHIYITYTTLLRRSYVPPRLVIRPKWPVAIALHSHYHSLKPYIKPYFCNKSMQPCRSTLCNALMHDLGFFISQQFWLETSWRTSRDLCSYYVRG